MAKGFKRLKGAGHPHDQRGKKKDKPRRQQPPARPADPFALYQKRDKRILEEITRKGANGFLDDYYDAREQCLSDPSAMEEMLSGIEDPLHKRLYDGLYKNYLIYIKSQKK